MTGHCTTKGVWIRNFVDVGKSNRNIGNGLKIEMITLIAMRVEPEYQMHISNYLVCINRNRSCHEVHPQVHLHTFSLNCFAQNRNMKAEK